MQRMQRKTTKRSNSMELLAPAGSFPAFEAALEAGADAVYVGAPGFNARALSRDFTFAEIGSMIRQAHKQGVRLYIAMNSLVKESELPAALEALSCFEELRPDALIIQDLGLLYLAKTWFPDLPLHASTLMSAHNSMAVGELMKLGFERVVLARELTIDEIGAIHRKTGAELEVFIHGAMCFSYSGLCLFSSLHGGKSSLRGQCVQPCRRHYSWQQAGQASRVNGRGNGRVNGRGRKGEGDRKEGRESKQKQNSASESGYLFSMNDLCGVDMLLEMRQAGVTCLKIEGRLKSAQYVANTVAAYRMALDCMDEPDAVQEGILREAHKLLDEAMGRKRSSGYLLSAQPTEAITPEQSGSSGRMLGRVNGIQQERTRDGRNKLTLQVILAAQVSEGDRLRLHDENSGNRLSFTLRSLQVQGRKQKTGRVGQKARLSLLVDRKEQVHRQFQGSLFKVDVGSRITAERSGRKRSQVLSSRKILPDKGKVEEILGHLAWQRGSVDFRRSGVGRENRKGQAGGQAVGRRAGRTELPWWVAVAKVGDLRQRLPVRPGRIILPLTRDNMRQLDQLADKIKRYRSLIIWCLPPVLHEADLDWAGKQIRTLAGAGYTRFELGHCCQYGLFLPLLEEGGGEGREGHNLELYGNYSLNLLNSAALRAASHLSYQGALFSLETEGNNLAAAVFHFKRQGGRGKVRQSGTKRVKMQVGLYVYGHPPLFTARLDSEHFRYHQSFISPQEEQFVLEHGDGLTTARAIPPFSLLKWRQEVAATGVDFLLLDLTGGSIKKEAAAVSTLLVQGGKQRAGKGQQPAVLQGNFDGVLV